MAAISKQTVTSVHHWNDSLFSFTTTRDQGLRFENGHFVMVGLEVEGRPLMRAYSIASANYEEELEFFSIKVPDGPLTSRLQNIKVGDGAEADTHLGPIQNSMQYGKVQDYFKDCQDNGHAFAVGGEIDDSAAGWFVPVTLVDNPPEDSRIVQEEPFGPILPLLKWSDEADVIARANDTIYGLGASVWGRI